MSAVPAPSHWDKAVYRACEICDHGRGPEGARLCACPEVAGSGAPVPVGPARANGGACGPEAYHQQFPGLVIVAEEPRHGRSY